MKIGLRLRRLKVNANINCLLPAPRTLYGKKQKRWHHKVYRRDQVAILNSVQSYRGDASHSQRVVETAKDAKSEFPVFPQNINALPLLLTHRGC